MAAQMDERSYVQQVEKKITFLVATTQSADDYAPRSRHYSIVGALRWFFFTSTFFGAKASIIRVLGQLLAAAAVSKPKKWNGTKAF